MVPRANNNTIQPSCFLRTKSTSRRKQEVRFGSVEVRCYDRTVGDNPSAYGPPLALAWKYTSKRFQSIKTYQQSLPKRQTYKDKFGRYIYHPLSYNHRSAILHKWGFSDADLKTVMRQMERIQNQRSQTKLFSTAFRLEQKLKQPVIQVKNRSVLKRANNNKSTKNAPDATPMKLQLISMHDEHPKQLLPKLKVMTANEFVC